ncbi:MAG: 23S rRNA (guanosine(2251)-2'-O)-methyltransferase RlmB [Acidobacteria bacterium]|nr:23S rRNA (guanosine(2251)-2'-O)-methyltransferase RlmB [Acidobacteriota bacterium]
MRTALEQHPRRVERVLLARDQRDHRARLVVALAREAGVPFQQVPRAALDRLAGELAHQGIAARLAGADLLEQDELIERLPTDAIALALDGVEDPRNVGAILRSAAGLGAHGVFLPVHRSAGLSPAAMKTAAGGLDVVPVARAGNLNRLIELLADRGLTPVALDVRGACAPWDAPLAGPVLLIAGSEEKGVRASVLERCRVRVAIPTAAAIGSLNVSVAVGIVLAEAMRQRKLAVLTAGSGDPGPVSPDP